MRIIKVSAVVNSVFAERHGSLSPGCLTLSNRHGQMATTKDEKVSDLSQLYTYTHMLQLKKFIVHIIR